jgi:predicted thioesterase
MENTAMKMIQKDLPVGFDSVGTEINVKHLKASAVGERIVFDATILDFDEKKVNFEITATNRENICIGKAFHTRYIIDLEKFMSKLTQTKT